MDLTLPEIFKALSVIEPSSYAVWAALTDAYPFGHFDEVIEETYGCFFDEDAQEELMEEVQKMKENSDEQLAKIEEILCKELTDLKEEARIKNEEIVRLHGRMDEEIKKA